MHLNVAFLRAYLDHELAETELARATAHLALCPVCRHRLEELQARAGRVSQQLTVLAPQPADVPRSPRPALSRFQAKLSASRKGWFIMPNSIFAPRLRLLWGGLLMLALAAAAINLQPVRAWAGEFLGLFRVRQVAVLPVDTSRLSELKNDQVIGTRVSQLVAANVTISREPGEPQPAADATEATRLAGYRVRLWKASPQKPRLTIQSGLAFELVMDRARAQAILEEMNRADLKLPANIDGAKIKVDVPNAVTAAYGECPHLIRPTANDAEDPDDEWRQAATTNCTLLVQVPSPTVVTPPAVDILPLIEIGLQLTGMTAEEARVYREKVDWTSTLVIPLPLYRSTYSEVTVDGVDGLLLQASGSPGHMLIWVKDEIIYALSSSSNSVSQMLDMANALE